MQDLILCIFFTVITPARHFPRIFSPLLTCPLPSFLLLSHLPFPDCVGGKPEEEILTKMMLEDDNNTINRPGYTRLNFSGTSEHVRLNHFSFHHLEPG